MKPPHTAEVSRHLGETAYRAYWRVLAPIALPWAQVTHEEKRAWQAAAREAIRSWDPEWRAQEDTPC